MRRRRHPSNCTRRSRCFDWHSTVHGHGSRAYTGNVSGPAEGRQISEALRRNSARRTSPPKLLLNQRVAVFRATWLGCCEVAEELHGWNDETFESGNGIFSDGRCLCRTICRVLQKQNYPIRTACIRTRLRLAFALDTRARSATTEWRR